MSDAGDEERLGDMTKRIEDILKAYTALSVEEQIEVTCVLINDHAKHVRAQVPVAGKKFTSEDDVLSAIPNGRTVQINTERFMRKLAKDHVAEIAANAREALAEHKANLDRL
jgi:hypothetical protein